MPERHGFIEVALDLLEGDLGQHMFGLLSKIPTDVGLGTEDARSHRDTSLQNWTNPNMRGSISG